MAWSLASCPQKALIRDQAEQLGSPGTTVNQGNGIFAGDSGESVLDGAVSERILIEVVNEPRTLAD
ncbi:hypothetical protein FA95DRAFT_250653 [Auriscalpium vulgare]|uniref:Uncharacterized protein n=1 Tax=Auriscalpium vulgare TaxID=40419 RepID=A0ACB8RLS5_9AGAM|nr:hypothetical protein FA95DRAFT_250653 [Auriscalpium vulgare]